MQDSSPAFLTSLHVTHDSVMGMRMVLLNLLRLPHVLACMMKSSGVMEWLGLRSALLGYSDFAPVELW